MAVMQAALALEGGRAVHSGGWPHWPVWDEREERALLDVLPFLFLCPFMMFFMMRGMGSGNDYSETNQPAQPCLSPLPGTHQGKCRAELDQHNLSREAAARELHAPVYSLKLAFQADFRLNVTLVRAASILESGGRRQNRSLLSPIGIDLAASRYSGKP